MEPVVRVGVTVTFLRMSAPPTEPGPVLPPDAAVVHLARPSVSFYRYLYDTVGGPYVWWLRRAIPPADLAAILRHPGVGIHVLYRGGEPAGFFELDTRPVPDVNLGYFGLMPHAVGHGLGHAFLRAAVDEAWRHRPRLLTVNTCTADHPRALPLYRRVGFRPVRQIPELWEVPVRLGMTIPEGLRI
ncbi:MAG TPA: GNAT family N-acetyltransferase [Acetobacteraceae bacterium]|nr:GNAT family N-acetyltransferase [Acetobacteraceae bacterium]